MKKIIYVILFLAMLFTLNGCRGTMQHQEKTLQKPEEKKEKITIVKNVHLDKIRGNLIPFSIDPENEAVVYCMKMADTIKDYSVIMGDYYRKVNVYRVNTEKSSLEELITGIDYITLAKWSYDKKYLGFVSGEVLYVYDKKTGEIHNINKNVNTPSTIYFGWSPDSKTIYTEHENFPNCDIYHVTTKEGTPRYKVKDESPYFKGYYRENLYIGTDEMADNYGNHVPITVLLNTEGKIEKNIAEGRFRDIQGEQLVQTGKNHFELIYTPDIYKAKTKILTREYIYQTAFMPQGELIYTTPGKAGEASVYQLHIRNASGKETVIEVSGPHFTIWPDGRYIDIGGYGQERIDMQTYKRIRGNLPSLSHEEEKRHIITVMAKAFNLYTDLYYHPLENKKEMEEKLAQYFTNTNEPVKQWALFDVCDELANRKRSFYGKKYHINGEIVFMRIRGDHATVKANFRIRDCFGTGWGFGTTYELVKNQGQWYITGLSTFPEEKERQKVEKLVKNFLEKTKQGKHFSFDDEGSRKIYEEIRNKDLTLGQIQFWRMSMPHLSPDIDQANYAKVYLEWNDKRYKLVLTKEGRRSWKILRLSDKALYFLL